MNLGNNLFPENPDNSPRDAEPTSTVVNGNLVVKSFPDGSTVVEPVASDVQPIPRHHKENLALTLELNEVREIGGMLKDAIEDDIQSQSAFFHAVSNLIKMMGLDLDTEAEKDDLPFKGASSVYSAKLFETLQSLNATVSKGIFKSSGMVDTCTVGHPNDQLNDASERMKDWFNYYFDNISKDFRKKAMQSANWTFVAGSSYKKVYICPVLRRPVSEAIPVEDFIINNSYSSHFTASRRTHRIYLSEKDFQTRINMGLYRNIHIAKQDDDSNNSDDVIRESLNKQIGYEPQGSRLDGMYVIYECHADLCIDGDNMVPKDNVPSPYIISLDAESGQVLRIVRNWKEGDPSRKRIEYFVNYFMLTALRGSGYGLVHYALRLAEAATSLERQLVNAAIYSNFPGGVYQQGVRFDNNNLCPAPGEWVPLMASGSIKDAIMALPYKEPSPALNELRKDFEESISKPSAIIDQKVFDMPSNAPATTTLSLLDQVHQVPNAILQNFYESFTRELELFKDRFAEWLQPGHPYYFKVSGGDKLITKEDFEASVNVIPAADPSTKNSAHRLIVSEIILNNAKASPDIYNVKFANELFLKQMNISKEDIEKLLAPPKDNTPSPQPQDPVTTMMSIIKGEPVIAAVWQNHDAYIAILDAWMQANPQDPHIQNAMALKTQYEAYKYMVDAYAAIGHEPPQDPSQLTPEQQNQLAVQIAHMKIQEMHEAQAQAAQQQGPSPMDLAAVELESAKMQAQIAHEKNEIDLKKLEVSEKKIEMDYQLSVQEFELKMKIQHLQAERESFKIAHEQALKERDQALKEKEVAIEEMQRQVEQYQRQEQMMGDVNG
jgi:hypothetical protein